MDKLTPTLNEMQLKQNIDAMHSQNVPVDKIQSYVDNYSKDPSGNYVLKQQAPQSFLQHEGSDLSQLGQDVRQIASPKFGEGLLNSTADVARLGILNPISHAIGAITPQPVKDLIGKGVDAVSQSAPGQSILNPIHKFANENPDIARAFGSATDIAEALPIVMGGAQAVHNLSASQTAPGISHTLSKLNYDPDLAENVSNTLSNTGNAAQYVADGNLNAAQTIVRNAMEGAQGQVLTNLQLASKAIADMSTVPFSPTALSGATSAVGNSVKSTAGLLGQGLKKAAIWGPAAGTAGYLYNYFTGKK